MMNSYKDAFIYQEHGKYLVASKKIRGNNNV